MSSIKDPHAARPLADWHEEDGDVLWWKFPVSEPPYFGSPLDLGQTVEVHTQAGMASRIMVGGWPGYHTHWTPITVPMAPALFRRRLESIKRKGGERVWDKIAGRRVLIWSGEHNAWWREGFSGYAINRHKAGIYDAKEAIDGTWHCGREKKISFEALDV
jgi:hypothetical protein